MNRFGQLGSVHDDKIHIVLNSTSPLCMFMPFICQGGGLTDENEYVLEKTISIIVFEVW